MRHLVLAAALLSVVPEIPAVSQTADTDLWPGFAASPWFGEQTRTLSLAAGARARILAPRPSALDTCAPLRLVVYATPNGNTLE